jgi:hypothetical protein
MSKDKAIQTQEELTGLLIAISIVSRRLAENIKKLQAGKEDAAAHAKPKPAG